MTSVADDAVLTSQESQVQSLLRPPFSLQLSYNSSPILHWLQVLCETLGAINDVHCGGVIDSRQR